MGRTLEDIIAEQPQNLVESAQETANTYSFNRVTRTYRG